MHGQGKNLFGDGFAVWYTKEKGELGNLFVEVKLRTPYVRCRDMEVYEGL